jgi:hypothetical protein
MGNHEHYSGEFQRTFGILQHFLLKWSNIRILNNETVSLTEKTMLFGATMWTDMNKRNPLAMDAARSGMNDFCGHIRNVTSSEPYREAALFTTESSVLEHEETLFALKQSLATHAGKYFLVMTHHTPSFMSIHPKYGNDLLNHAYSSDLSNLILDNPKIKNWTHGHTHDSFDYCIGDTRVMCNPRGYTNNPNIPPENVKFDINFNFEVE